MLTESDIIIFRTLYVHFINGNFEPTVCFLLSNASSSEKYILWPKKRRLSLCYHSPSDKAEAENSHILCVQAAF